MPTDNLWGDIDEDTGWVSPMEILEEQAAALSKLTMGKLHGEVARKATGDARKISATLYVVAPVLDRYRYAVCMITYDPTAPYPARIQASAEKAPTTTRCDDDKAFTEALTNLLQSPAVKGAVASLIRESKARSL